MSSTDNPLGAQPITVYMTASTFDEARKIASALVDKKLAACVSIVPGAESVYWWQGEVCRDTEILILAKTVRGLFDELNATVRALHSYTTPCIVAWDIVQGDERYLAWLVDSIQKNPAAKRSG